MIAITPDRCRIVCTLGGFSQWGACRWRCFRLGPRNQCATIVSTKAASTNHPEYWSNGLAQYHSQSLRDESGWQVFPCLPGCSINIQTAKNQKGTQIRVR